MHYVAQCQLKLRKKRWLHNGKQTAASSMAHGESKSPPIRYTMAMISVAVSPKSYARAKCRSGLIGRQISKGGKGV